jgi:hypothetical protein
LNGALSAAGMSTAVAKWIVLQVCVGGVNTYQMAVLGTVPQNMA